MNIEEIRNICFALPHVTEDIKWGNNLTFLIAKKIFLVVGLEESPVRASLKVPPEQFEDLTEHDGIIQAPYFAKNQWILVQDINNLSFEEWKYYAQQSYQLVKSKLSKRTLLELQ